MIIQKRNGSHDRNDYIRRQSARRTVASRARLLRVCLATARVPINTVQNILCTDSHVNNGNYNFERLGESKKIPRKEKRTI